MSKKSFSVSKDFLTPSVSEEKHTPVRNTGEKKRPSHKEESTEGKYAPPEGYKLVPTESKTARLQLLITPTTKEQLKRRSEAEGRSVNDICNQAITDYLSRR